MSEADEFGPMSGADEFGPMSSARPVCIYVRLKSSRGSTRALGKKERHEHTHNFG